MGNASAREGENGHMASSPELAARNGGGSSSAGVAAARPPPLSPLDAVMLEQTPPVPYLFVPQVPVTPLQRPTEFSPVFNHSPINGTDESTTNHSQEKGIPTLITWSQGGNEVFLEGSWDNWTSRRALERSGKDHAILLVLPSGVYHYRIIVDGELRYIPEQPCVTDERGQLANLLDVHVSKDTIFLFHHSNL
ncbi:SNF1-related protein kinase regulatory subunit beta-1-like [Panicum miliaceum]|uniref:SNF1-related protein kinase regulatory subunit beta-1-like n=1 Tax=Panicum miliaceum TaxID=4540 RepID=A0A3L6T185_PANMI|nr:SNF1-related protein kinase regulatory subunit beta-1-like [Panicum miliaceum]